ncbi:MAG: UDP-N-acetylmuramoyl-L-alanine--D-glutamate ligase [Myxococcota bacterium]
MGWLDFDKFAVFGLGRSGIAAANLLARHDKHVLASDTRPRDSLTAASEKLDESVEIVGGGNAVGDAECVVVSPGLRPSLAIFDEVREAGLPVLSEVELGWEAASAPIIGITGTDGKSTTTRLVEHLLLQVGREARAGGNLGTPLCEFVEEVPGDGVIVAEVSAFQLWSIHNFQAHSIGFTNISHDHLDYFDSYREYVEAKKALMKNAGDDTLGVFNAGDEYLRTWANEYSGRTLAYGGTASVVSAFDEALWLDDGRLMARLEGRDAFVWVEDIDELPLRGAHNFLNLMCAAGLATSVGEPLEELGAAAEGFEPLPHRMEFCGEVDGVRFFDDSKATNVNAAIAGLTSIDGRIVPIVGGVDKNLDLAPLISLVRKRADNVVVIGEIADRVQRELIAAGFPDARIHRMETMRDAVRRAFELAQIDGASVSLSPACSSFDMYESYAERGDVFQKVVSDLEKITSS